MLSEIKKNPFRLFFPVGWLLGLSGALLWILFHQGIIDGNPKEHHGHLMIGGFLLSFVMGFLMTAIPRFTKTEYANSLEIIISVVLVFLMSWSGLFYVSGLFNITSLLGLLFIIAYSVRRFIKRESNPPDTFIFVGVALLMGLLGISLVLSHEYYHLGELLFFQGMPFSLVLGVGGRLVPGILGHGEVVKAQRDRYENLESFFKIVPAMNYLLAMVFVASFFTEHYLSQVVGHALRAVVISYIATVYWRIFKFPVKRTVHTFSIWLACLFIFSGSWLYSFLPSIHVLHLIYIGGFGFITLLVASRVTLAHGDGGMEIEGEKFPFLWICILLSLSAVTRASAYLFPAQYQSHISYSAGLWIVGFIIWGIVFIPRICTRQRQ